MPRAALNRIDLRATRFAALVTSIVLGLALVLGPVYGLPLIAVQTLVFAIGAVMGMRLQPYLVIYEKFIRPRRGTPVEAVSEFPHRFTAGIGMLIGCLSLLSGVMSATILYYLVTGFAFAVAVIHAATGRCLGCAWYERIVASLQAPAPSNVDLTTAPPVAEQRPEHDTLA